MGVLLSSAGDVKPDTTQRVAATENVDEGRGFVMLRLWKVPGAIAEYAVGTVIVMVQLGMLSAIERREYHRRERARAQMLVN
jgi:hypothetical protein